MFGLSKTGGHWAQEELTHINCLQMKAVLLVLKSPCDDCRHTHIRVQSDKLQLLLVLIGVVVQSLTLIYLWKDFYVGTILKYDFIS